MKRESSSSSQSLVSMSILAASVGWLSGCREYQVAVVDRPNEGRVDAAPDDGSAEIPAASFEGGVCEPSEVQEEGPFYTDLGWVREELAETQLGASLEIRITVFDRRTCLPIQNAAVDLWMANAFGDFSDGFLVDESGAETTTTFQRGVQYTDDDGLVVLNAIYPGWYEDRVSHVHFKVHLGGEELDGFYRHGSTGTTVHTGQLFFPDDANEAIRTIHPYNKNAHEFLNNETDRVYLRQSSEDALLSVTRLASGVYRATAWIVVDPNDSAEAR